MIAHAAPPEASASRQKGVGFTAETVQRFSSTDVGLRDSFGNWLRTTPPSEVTAAALQLA